MSRRAHSGSVVIEPDEGDLYEPKTCPSRYMTQSPTVAPGMTTRITKKDDLLSEEVGKRAPVASSSPSDIPLSKCTRWVIPNDDDSFSDRHPNDSEKDGLDDADREDSTDKDNASKSINSFCTTLHHPMCFERTPAAKSSGDAFSRRQQILRFRRESKRKQQLLLAKMRDVQKDSASNANSTTTTPSESSHANTSYRPAATRVLNSTASSFMNHPAQYLWKPLLPTACANMQMRSTPFGKCPPVMHFNHRRPRPLKDDNSGSSSGVVNNGSPFVAANSSLDTDRDMYETALILSAQLPHLHSAQDSSVNEKQRAD